MSFNDNFERAKKLTGDWPDWKREYQLTKYSQNKKEPVSGHTAPSVDARPNGLLGGEALGLQQNNCAD